MSPRGGDGREGIDREGPAVTTFRYFAWVRERIGEASEEIELPAGVARVADLPAFLAARSEGHAAAMGQPGAIRFALDQEAAEPGDAIGGAREIAVFPPMTGG